MKKKLSILMATLLVGSAAGSLASCGGSDTATLSYGYGVSSLNTDSPDYNGELFGYNHRGSALADVSTIYVPEDRVHKDGKTYPGFYSFGTGGTRGEVIPDDRYPSNVVGLEAPCYYSPNLYTWNKEGGSEMQGYALVGLEDDWEAWNVEGEWGGHSNCDIPWAAEVIWDEEEQKYYMFYNTTAKKRGVGSEIYTTSRDPWDRLYGGIAVSDYPQGPYYTVSAIDEFTGEKTPILNFRKAFGLDYDYPAIDFSPFIDDVDSDGDGKLDKYLFFTKHGNYDNVAAASKQAGVLGMKMKSWTEPDFESMRYVLYPGYVSCTSKSGTELAQATSNYVTGTGDFDGHDPGINEGVFCIKRNGKYYLSFSGDGYKSQAYNIIQAVSDNPLEGYVKPSISVANPVLSGFDTDYVKGTGHHSIVKVEDEWFIAYHIHGSPISYEAGWGRYMYTDRLQWFTASDGIDYMTANGPTQNLVWIPEAVSDYKNVATDATITVNHGEGVEYLNDGLVPYYQYVEEKVFASDENKDLQITLNFETPQTIAAVMVYNGQNQDKTFSQIKGIKFNVAEKPAWAKKAITYATIANVPLPSVYYVKDESCRPSVPVVAEFDDIVVSSITITIAVKDRVMLYAKDGSVNTDINISEVVVLGRK